MTLPQEDWFDTGCTDLILRMSYGGTRTFRVRHGENGAKRTYKLGRWDPKTFNVQAARKAKKEFEPPKKATISTDDLPEAKAWWLKATFSDVIERYLVDVVSHFRTKKEVERCYRLYVMPKLGTKQFLELEQDDAGNLRSAMRKERGARIADIVFGLIRAVMVWVEEERVIKGYSSPIRYLSKRRRRNGGSKGRKVTLDPAELRLVWQAATDMGGHFGALVRLLLLTAQRRQCLTTAKWSEIVDGVWHIRDDGPDAKGTGKVLRLPPLAVEILNGLPRVKGNPYVFGVEHKGQHIPFNSFSQRNDEIRERLPPDMKRWTLHDLRRTARSLMGEIGDISPHVAEAVLGHKLQGVEGIYNQAQMLDLKAEALLLLSNRIVTIVSPPPARKVSMTGNVIALNQARRA